MGLRILSGCFRSVRLILSHFVRHDHPSQVLLLPALAARLEFLLDKAFSIKNTIMESE
ncbi:hypothetical protein D3C86_2154030 [compost metagenome]